MSDVDNIIATATTRALAECTERQQDVWRAKHIDGTGHYAYAVAHFVAKKTSYDALVKAERRVYREVARDLKCYCETGQTP
jgi:hypothetical protein